MPPSGCDQSALTGSHTTGTITSGSSFLGIAFDNNFKNGCGIFIAGAGPLSTLSTPSQGSAPNPNVIGTTGSTTVHYKIAAIDANYGTSAASAAITVATAPATRTALNYVGIYWTSVANAVGYLVYTDQNGGGSYVPLGYSFECSSFIAGNVCGIIDKGVETNSWTGSNGFWPTAPPAAASNQALITTITSGAGTLSLVLAATASNSVTSAFTIPDNSMFIQQALSAAAADGSPQTTNRGTVFIPQGLWYMSTIPLPSTIAGVKIVQAGAIQLFGLPVGSNLTSTGASGNISITGTGGVYDAGNWALSCSNISGTQTLGALFLVEGPGGTLDLSHLCLNSAQTGIVQDTQGGITTQDVSFAVTGSGPMLQIDNNAFFSIFDRTNWNDGANNSNNGIPAIWFLGLTNTGHTSIFDFRDNTFVTHTIRIDQPFPGSGGPVGPVVFDGTTSVEDNWDPCFICLQTNDQVQSFVFDNVTTGDVQTSSGQALIYSYNSSGPNAGNNNVINGYTAGFNQLLGGAFSATSERNCFGWIYETPNYGGNGVQSLGNWGDIFGTYTGCDLGITQIGGDVQTNEVLTAGGNDGRGPAGEQMIGHVFRRPVASVSSTGSGSLTAATYYIRATVVDAAGRESAPSQEISQAVGASSSINLSAATMIYFPASCNFYFGTSAGGEASFFSSTAVTNGTCTFTLTTTSGASSAAPKPVGNAMRSWLTEENNGSSCLFCGFSGGLGTGFLGFNLNAAQYAAPPTGVQFPFNGGVHSYKFYSASETTAPAGTANVDELYADSTAHRWKKIENNGAAQTVGSADSSACAYQGPGSAVTGTGAAATYFTCTLPAGVMGAGQGIIITAVAKHTTGTAAVTYTLSFGGTSTTAVAPAGAANQLERISYLIMNNPGSTSAQTISTLGQDSNAGSNSIKLDTATVSTASAVTINLQFNVASTDAVTPEMFLVELKQ
jgi:hypothetical protein